MIDARTSRGNQRLTEIVRENQMPVDQRNCLHREQTARLTRVEWRPRNCSLFRQPLEHVKVIFCSSLFRQTNRHVTLVRLPHVFVASHDAINTRKLRLNTNTRRKMPCIQHVKCAAHDDCAIGKAGWKRVERDLRGSMYYSWRGILVSELAC